MLSNLRQLSKWLLQSKSSSILGLITKPAVGDAVPGTAHQCTLSVISSQSMIHAQPTITGHSVAHKTPAVPSPRTHHGSLNVTSVRSYMRVYYKPSAWKRYNKHNIEKRLTTPAGLEILWRRVLKNKQNLAVYQRILPAGITHDSKILAKHQLRFRKHPLTKHRLPKPGLF